MAVFMPAEPGRAQSPGFALFALGFRPFYLLAGLYAALAVPLWGLQYAGWLGGANPLWHAHEMLFGYAFAVIAGFLLTAVRAWTSRPTPSRAPLAALALIWIAARVSALYSLQASSLLDALFALGIAWGIGRPIFASRNRNGYFVVFVLALGAASIAFQAYPRVALAAGLDVVLLVVAIMGGRVIPAFTNNAVPGAGARRNRWLEHGSLGSVILLLLLDLLQLPAWPVALAAAVLHAARVAMWAPLATRGRPILWILHLSYAWVAVHLLMRGLAGLDLVPAALATHALTVGVIGGLTLGMMTRTARGHTARPLKVGVGEVACYGLVQASAVVRVALPLFAPGAYVAWIGLSAALWCAAFSIFVAVYWPILSRPRLDGQPG
ncbi:MAG TPA: NnrS family protein [Burkholderiales bacterium]|nr:NnrS family protein [Burkholderiales bacterium]